MPRVRGGTESGGAESGGAKSREVLRVGRVQSRGC